MITSTKLFERFSPALCGRALPRVRDPHLLLEVDGPIRIYYAPFEHINPQARIVLVGITPGPTQMSNANMEARNALMNGADAVTAMKAAKQTAGFSGQPMRSNLLRQLDHWGVPQWLGLQLAAELFGESADLLQTTSLLRYPVFVNDKDYKGTPDMLKNPVLRKYLEQHFVTEVAYLDQAVFFGLGPQVQSVLNALVVDGILPAERVIGGMLHPSPNCTYRIDYLVGERSEPVPHATNPRPYDDGRELFRQRFLGLTELGLCQPAPLRPKILHEDRASSKQHSSARYLRDDFMGATNLSNRQASNAGLAEAAEGLLSTKLRRIAPGTKYIAGFITLKDRHIAIERERNGIYVWTEKVTQMVPGELAKFLRRGYAAGKSRNSNLNATNASRLTVGNPVDYWRFDTLGDLRYFLGWYAN